MRATTSGWEIVWPGADRQRDVVPRLAGELGGDEQVARDGAHRLQHALVLDVRAQLLDQPVRAEASSRDHAAGGAHLGQRAPRSRPAATSTPRAAVLSTVTWKPARSASSAVFLTQ